MMGSVGASNALVNLLKIVSDPKKSQKFLDDLSKRTEAHKVAAGEAQASLAQVSKAITRQAQARQQLEQRALQINQQADLLAAQQAELDDKRRAFEDHTKDKLARHEQAVSDTTAILVNEKADLAARKKLLDQAIKNHEDESSALSRRLDRMRVELAEREAAAETKEDELVKKEADLKRRLGLLQSVIAPQPEGVS